MKGRSLIRIALSLVLTFVLTLVMVAVPSDLASAANNSNKPSDSVKIERNQNPTDGVVSETAQEESQRVEPNVTIIPGKGEDEDLVPEGCPPRDGCPPREYRVRHQGCRKCP